MHSQLGAVDVRSYLLELRCISITGVTAARGCHHTYALGGRSRVGVESCDHLEVEAAAVITWRLSGGRGRCQNRSHRGVMGEGWCGET